MNGSGSNGNPGRKDCTGEQSSGMYWGIVQQTKPAANRVLTLTLAVCEYARMRP